MHFVAALDRVPEMRGVLCLFEGVCSGAADGYARMLGKPAATLLHLGPGLANGLANFHNARKARSPIVSLVGEHSTKHLEFDAPLTSDIEAFARTVSEEVFRLGSAAEMGETAVRVMAAARRYPGRIAHLIVAADYSWSESGAVGVMASEELAHNGLARPRQDGRVPRPLVPRPRGLCAFEEPAHDGHAAAREPGRDPRPLEPSRSGLRASEERPRVAAGGDLGRGAGNWGILLGGRTVRGQGLALAARLGAAGWRVLIDRNAARVEAGRGRYQPPRMEYFPGPAQAQLTGLTDLVLLEAKAPVSFFGYPDEASYLVPSGCRVHELAGIEEDGTAALEELVASLGLGPAGWAEPEAAMVPEDGPLTLEAIGQAVAALLPEGAIVSDEMVSSGPPVLAALPRAAWFDYLPVTGGSIGQGMPVGVGAAVACPGRKVVVLEGDGSAMYTPQSWWTMAREGLDVVTVIFANRRYRILDIEMRRTGANGFGAQSEAMVDIGRPELDFVQVARGMGVAAVRVETAGEFVREFGAAMRERGPRVIEAVI